MSHSHPNSNGEAYASFPGPENQASYTCAHVLEQGRPILRVTHDDDDGAWQFLCGGLHASAAEGRVVCLGCTVGGDNSLRELADLPVGWCAHRDSVGGPWERSPSPPSPDE
jgi:hypothetical protein